MPILALLLFGGVAGSSELQDFAFALLIGVASGAYSSIFIASPVLTHSASASRSSESRGGTWSRPNTGTYRRMRPPA